MINKILPICKIHDSIKLFEQLYGNINKGLIIQSFCEGLNELRRDFYVVVNMIERELSDE
jgi:hypothetical protein